MLFTFAGSTHHKYASYLLEMICNVVLESKPDLKTSVFESWLVNPSGLPGHWIEGDLYQEQLQNQLYEHIGGKDAAFAEKYVQHVIAPNVHRFVRVKKDINESLGLVHRSGKHIALHTNPELRKHIRLKNRSYLEGGGRTVETKQKWTSWEKIMNVFVEVSSLDNRNHSGARSKFSGGCQSRFHRSRDVTDDTSKGYKMQMQNTTKTMLYLLQGQSKYRHTSRR